MGGREGQFEALVQMALAGQEGRSQAVRDMWAGETEKARLDLKSSSGPGAAGAVKSVLKGGVAGEAQPAAAAGGVASAAGAVPARRRVAPPAGKSKVE